MRLLVVGGTRFVGRHVVTAALAAGHEVALLHRGTARDDLFPEAEHLHADRDAGLGVLAGRGFDATIDVTAYHPCQVASLAAALGGRGGRCLVVSSTSVYAVPAGPGFDESSPTVAAAGPDVDVVTDETYGPLKVAVEQETRRLHGSGATVVRPTYVVGPWDHTRRFTSWVQRVAEGGEVLAPGDPTDPVQLVDARDLATLCVRLVEDDVPGTFHAVGQEPPYTFGDMLSDVAAVVAPTGTSVTWVASDWLLAQGETGATVPLWEAGDPWLAVNTASPAAARAAGLPVRPVRESVAALVEHLRREPPTGPGPGLSRDREAALLAAWNARG